MEKTANPQDRLVSMVALFSLIPLSIWGYFYYQQNGVKGLNIFLGALATLALYSILYRENPVYRMIEHIYLGLAAGYVVVIAWTETIQEKWYQPIFVDGKWLWLWCIPLAIMAYMVFSKRHGWISRIPIVILAGFVSGQVFQQFAARYFPQIRNSFKSIRPTQWTLTNPDPAPGRLSISEAINNGLFMLTIVTVTCYFLFSFEQKGKVVPKLSLMGRWLLMIGFGAIFGSTIMTRFALLVDRMYFLLIQWLHLRPPIG